MQTVLLTAYEMFQLSEIYEEVQAQGWVAVGTLPTDAWPSVQRVE